MVFCQGKSQYLRFVKTIWSLNIQFVYLYVWYFSYFKDMPLFNASEWTLFNTSHETYYISYGTVITTVKVLRACHRVHSYLL